MDRGDLDILAGRLRTLRAGDETIEIKEPPGEFYTQSWAKILEIVMELKETDPALLKEILGGKLPILRVLRQSRARDILFEVLGLLVPEKGAEWFKKNVGLRGLVICVRAAIEVIGIQEVRDNFFALMESLEGVIPKIGMMKEEGSSSDS